MLPALLALLLAAPPEPKPRFCVARAGADPMSGSCIDVSANEIDVEKAAVVRSWIWLDAARKTVAIGTVPADVSKVVVDAKPAALLTLDGSSERGWPSPATFVLGTSKFTLPREIVSRVRAVALPDGTYDLRIEAPHHLAYERRELRMSRAKPLQLGLITLKPMPRLRGRFIDRQGGPVADVAVSTPEGTVLATSDATGAVREEVCDALPDRVFVRASGYGHRTVEITRHESDLDFGTVTLAPGATLTIRVDRNGDVGPITTLLLRTNEHNVGRRTTFASQTIDGDTTMIELRDLEARDYVLLLRGDAPLEVLREDIKIAEGENATKDVRLDPRTVKGFVHQGSAPMVQVALDFTGANGEWRSSVVTDDEGRFRSAAWKEGYVGIDVGRPLPPKYSTDRRIGPTDTEWDIDVPDRRIRGTVVDKETGHPVPVTHVDVSYRRGDSSGMFFLAAEESRFELPMLEPGHYEFTAGHAEYLSSTAVVDLQPEDHVREVRIEMQRGFEMRVNVVNAEGLPAGGAEIIASRTPNGVPRSWITDGSGMATLRLQTEESLGVWVLAQTDSFAFVTLEARKNSEPARVVLPPDNATIAIRATHADGTLAVHAHLLFSYNGRFAPDDVRESFIFRGVRMVTGSDGTLLLTHMPAGEYDFFTIETPEEHIVFDGKPTFAGMHASILPGENHVTLRVSRIF